MRALKTLLAGFITIAALLGGFLVVAIVVVVSAAMLMVNRLFRRSALLRPPSGVRVGRRQPTWSHRPADAIDIEATEVR